MKDEDKTTFGVARKVLLEVRKALVGAKDTVMSLFLGVQCRGHLKVTLDYGTHQVVHLDKKNLVVKNGRQLLLAPLYLTGRVSDPVSTLRVGSGGTLDVNGQFPKTPVVDTSALYSQTLSTPTSYTYDSSRPSVTYLADISETQGNGTMISEAGLFTVAGIMFNIKTFGGIPKTSAFSIHFEWTIAVI